MYLWLIEENLENLGFPFSIASVIYLFGAYCPLYLLIPCFHNLIFTFKETSDCTLCLKKRMIVAYICLNNLIS